MALLSWLNLLLSFYVLRAAVVQGKSGTLAGVGFIVAVGAGLIELAVCSVLARQCWVAARTAVGMIRGILPTAGADKIAVPIFDKAPIVNLSILAGLLAVLLAGPPR